MSSPENVKIVAFVGLPGSGVSTAIGYLSSKGYPKVYLGGILLDKMKEQGIDRTADNEAAFRREIRETSGNDVLVLPIIEQIKKLVSAGQHRIVVDGLYSWDEYKILNHAFPGELTIVAVVAPKHIRHVRLENRDVRPLSISESQRRDWDEIETINKGGPIAIADHFITNAANISSFHKEIDTLLHSIQFLG
jgi:dephospho-CoA kinase